MKDGRVAGSIAMAMIVLLGGVLAAEEQAVERFPAGSRLVALDLSPREFHLAGPYEYSQILLRGILDNGDSVDVTRLARVDGSAGLIQVSPSGLARPLREGQGVVTFRVADRRVSAPVTVTGLLAPREISFVRDVMPLLSRIGCNAGTCHGSQSGKNGFKLSLRGYDPQADHRALTDDLGGRRFDRASPEHSLMLLKPSGGVPHAGGVLTHPGEASYEIMRSWIAAGVKLDLGTTRVVALRVEPKDFVLPLPGTKQQLAVRATYSDGTERDVSAQAFLESSNADVASVARSGLVSGLRRGESTILARYEGAYAASAMAVMGDRRGFRWIEPPEHNFIDALVSQKLRRLKVLPSGPCTEAEFVRRIYLDLTGLSPAPEDLSRFLADPRPSMVRRDALVERLVGSPEFVEHWTNKWADLLQVNRRHLGEDGARALRAWIRRAIADNMPYDRFVYSILSASGSTLENPPAAYFKTLREPGSAMENTTQLFLAIRFNCNKCHDHPFERWTQDQYYQLAASFARVSRREDPRHKGQTLPGTDVEAAQPLVEQIGDTNTGEVRHERTGAVAAPAFPFRLACRLPAKGSRREQLARWVTAPENPYFARSYVNRLWSYLLGIGLIEPVDDMRAGNPPSNPPLLDRLAAEFVGHGFDMRHVIRLICKSRAYQRSVETNAWNRDDDVNFSHALARRLPAEVLYDAVQQFTGSASHLPGLPPGGRAAQLLDSEEDVPGGFFSLFGKPPRESACECERSSGLMLGPVLNLVNGPVLADAVRDPHNRIATLVARENDDGHVVDALFLGALCRPPSPAEKAAALIVFRGREADQAALVEEYSRRLAALAARERQLPARQREWEQRYANGPRWQTLTASCARASGGASLAVQPDGALVARGRNAPFESYRIESVVPLNQITAIRLEVFSDLHLPHGGPGRAPNGNFVLTELRVAVTQPGQAPEKGIPITRAAADYSQEGYSVATAFDGLSETGWAVGPASGEAHVAVFGLRQPICLKPKTRLVVILEQRFPGKNHNLGRFRLSVTGCGDPLREPLLPPAVAAIVAKTEKNRAANQKSRLADYYRARDTELGRLARALSDFPPPPADRRLLAAQDIAWALLNSPAFQFNH